MNGSSKTWRRMVEVGWMDTGWRVHTHLQAGCSRFESRQMRVSAASGRIGLVPCCCAVAVQRSGRAVLRPCCAVLCCAVPNYARSIFSQPGTRRPSQIRGCARRALPCRGCVEGIPLIAISKQSSPALAAALLPSQSSAWRKRPCWPTTARSSFPHTSSPAHNPNPATKAERVSAMT